MKQPKEFSTLLALAEQGNNRARFHIGFLYYYGRDGVEQKPYRY